MNCQVCAQSPAVVHITDLYAEPGAPALPAGTQFSEQHLCDACAKGVELAAPAPASPALDVWKLLVGGAGKAQPAAPTCPDCGWTLADFRSKGRLGCPRDYEVFGEHIHDLLERIHGSAEHTGRLPGRAEPEPDPELERAELREQLADAIQSEEYERAAELRDRLHALERGQG